MKKMNEQNLGAAIQLLSMSYQGIAGQLNQQLDIHTLNMTQMSILTHFARKPHIPHTISQLAVDMQMNQPGVTKAMNSMVKHGLFTKVKDETDSRISHIYITEFGIKRLQDAQRACLPVLASVFGSLNQVELQQLTHLLGKLHY